jgi:hypothetical protein
MFTYYSANDDDDAVVVVAKFWQTLVSRWRGMISSDFVIFDRIIGRLHIKAEDVKNFEAENPWLKKFFMVNEKQTKDEMKKMLVPGQTMIALSITPPTLINQELRPSHALVYLVVEQKTRESKFNSLNLK